MTAADEQDTTTCESCNGVFPSDDCVPAGDVTFCQGCYDRWLVKFHSCEHRFEPGTDDHGEPGKFCPKCGGFVCEPPESIVKK